jgi:4-amino-4-deoxy-L-arabinose transferase-like glycosyltransferase
MSLLIPFGIGGSWRECDTQAIARNFLRDGFDPLRPRVDWRGDTDGAVECEFPLYQTMIATVMTVVGEAEWPGRVISMLAIAMAALSLHRLLEARSGGGGALIGALVFLGSGQAMMLGSRVMPDALSTAFALAGTVAFVQFLATGQGRTLLLATAMTTVACLCKPTALQVGLLQFVWTVLMVPRRLREPRIWLGWATVLAVVAAWLVHGASLHAETGLTFGVASGGETKFPTWRSLRNLDIWASLGRTTLLLGFGGLGAVALLLLALRRRLDRVDLALLAVVALGLVGTLAYSFHPGVGPQYHVFATVAGAFLAGRAWPERAPRLLWFAALAAIVATASVMLARERAFRQTCLDGAPVQTSADIAAISVPTDLAVVRSPRTRYNDAWRRRSNYEEPVLFYHAQRHGWVLPRDGFEPVALADLKRRGARIIVDQYPAETTPEAEAWLEANAELKSDRGGRRVYRLRDTP